MQAGPEGARLALSLVGYESELQVGCPIDRLRMYPSIAYEAAIRCSVCLSSSPGFLQLDPPRMSCEQGAPGMLTMLRSLQTAMAFVFGNSFICRDYQTAEKVRRLTSCRPHGSCCQNLFTSLSLFQVVQRARHHYFLCFYLNCANRPLGFAQLIGHLKRVSI